MARSFNGTTSDYITLANESNFDFERTDACSFTFWVYKDGTPAATKAIIGKTGTGAEPGWNIQFRASSSQFAVNWRSAFGNQIVKYTTASIGTGTWHRCAVTKTTASNAAAFTLYVNGTTPATTVGEDTLSASILNNNAALIGAIPGPLQPFDGDIAEVKVWAGVVLTAEEVEWALRGGFPQWQAIRAYVPLFGIQSPEPDWSGLNNHGTVTGTSTADHPPGVSAYWLAPQPKRVFYTPAAAVTARIRRTLVGVGI